MTFNTCVFSIEDKLILSPYLSIDYTPNTGYLDSICMNFQQKNDFLCLFDATIHAKDVLIATGVVQKSVFIFQSILTTKQCQTVIKIDLLHLGMYYQWWHGGMLIEYFIIFRSGAKLKHSEFASSEFNDSDMLSYLCGKKLFLPVHITW